MKNTEIVEMIVENAENLNELKFVAKVVGLKIEPQMHTRLRFKLVWDNGVVCAENVRREEIVAILAEVYRRFFR